MSKQTSLRELLESPYDQEGWKNLLEKTFGLHPELWEYSYDYHVPDAAKDIATKITILCEVEFKRDRIAFCQVDVSESVWMFRNRKQVREVIKNLYRDNFDGVIVVFVQKKKWRLSYISQITIYDNEGNPIEKTTDWRRYTYLLGEGENARTASERLQLLATKKSENTLKDIEDAFSIEKLTSEFYNELFSWYQWTTTSPELVSFPEKKGEQARIERQIIRLITRILFVWFIKKKNFVTEKLFQTEYLKTILKDFEPNSEQQFAYYNAILQNLFFATLNRDIDDRKFVPENSSKREEKTLFRFQNMFKIPEKEVLEIFYEIPKLNGGLFECLDKEVSNSINKEKVHIDGFSRNNTTKERAFIANCVFFNSQKGDASQGLFTILEKYNFTVEENSTENVQVALDPELLGNVFENLLGEFDQTTRENARKNSGSFYTPKEIVAFMTKTSLEHFIKLKFQQIPQKDIKQLFTQNTQNLPESFDYKTCKEITEAICKAKILDPACGSGAFPMGILNEIITIIDKLGYVNFNEFQKVYELKKIIIEQAIYGIDYEFIAVQITKLRFFISLVIEQEIDRNNKDNYGILTLPNLETKIIAADTLAKLEIEDTQNENGMYEDEKTQDQQLKDLKKELETTRKQHFHANSSYKKAQLVKNDEKIRNKISQRLKEIVEEKNNNRIIEAKKEIERQQQKKERYKEKLMVTQTVQTDMFETNKTKTITFDLNKQKRVDIDNKIKQLNKDIEKTREEQENPKLKDEIEKLTQWNPYDPNSVAQYFDPDTMFQIDKNSGFDIIIGNPPYIQMQKNGGKLYQKYKYLTFSSMGDIYSLFYERGCQLLKNGGLLCYITSNKWMRANYGLATRQFFIENTLPQLLVDFGGQKIFQNATVDTNILLTKKRDEHSRKREKTSTAVITINKPTDNLYEHVNQNAQPIVFDSAESWTILSPIQQAIKQKVEVQGTPLKDWNISINYGIKTGYNEAFIIDEQKRAELIEQDPKSTQIIKPILRGRDIKRYSYEWKNLWLLYIPWHFPLHKDPNIKGASEKAEQEFKKQYPAVYNHLLKHKEKLSKRNKTEMGIRYEWYALQRWGANYWQEFSKEKVVWNRIAKEKQFSLVKSGVYIQDSMHFFTGEHVFVCCIKL